LNFLTIQVFAKVAFIRSESLARAGLDCLYLFISQSPKRQSAYGSDKTFSGGGVGGSRRRVSAF